MDYIRYCTIAPSPYRFCFTSGFWSSRQSIWIHSSFFSEMLLCPAAVEQMGSGQWRMDIRVATVVSQIWNTNYDQHIRVIGVNG